MSPPGFRYVGVSNAAPKAVKTSRKIVIAEKKNCNFRFAAGGPLREGDGNKYEVLDPFLNTVEIIHSDWLKKTTASDSVLDKYKYIPSNPSLLASLTSTHSTHNYNLRQ